MHFTHLLQVAFSMLSVFQDLLAIQIREILCSATTCKLYVIIFICCYIFFPETWIDVSLQKRREVTYMYIVCAKTRFISLQISV